MPLGRADLYCYDAGCLSSAGTCQTLGATKRERKTARKKISSSLSERCLSVYSRSLGRYFELEEFFDFFTRGRTV